MFVLCIASKDKRKVRKIKTKKQVRKKYKEITRERLQKREKKIPVVEIFRTRPDRSWGPHSLL